MTTRKEIVKAALPIANAHNRVGAMEYIEGRILGEECEKHDKLLTTWRTIFLDWLKLGEFKLEKLLFKYAKMCEGIRNGILPYIVVI